MLSHGGARLRTRQSLDGREQLPYDWERTESIDESWRVKRGRRKWRSSVLVQVIKEQESCSNHSGIRLLETMKMWERIDCGVTVSDFCFEGVDGVV